MHSTDLARLIAGILLGTSPSFSLMAADGCPAVPPSERARLERYVAKRFELSENIRITATEAAVISDSCYRKMLFAGQGPLGTFSLTLFVSPDFRYVASELLDSTVDPEREREEKARKLMGELTDGEFPSIGPVTASVTVVVFSDFECPFCKQAAGILRAEPLIRDGSVRLIFRHMPLPQHTWARYAAEGAACAQFQSAKAFWALHDAFFANQTTLTGETIATKVSEFAAGVPSLDQAQFKECLSRQMSLGTILRDKEMGTRVGVQGTPTVFVNGQLVSVLNAPQKFHDLLEQAVSRSGSAEGRQRLGQTTMLKP